MIDKLGYLIALAREEHFGRAAEACGVTQQTLSAGVKSLEDRFGVRLVQRGSRFQGFTPEGRRVLDWARRIVADNRSMHAEVSAARRALSGRLRIAAIPTALPMVAALTTPYRARHPEVRFTIESRASTEILDLFTDLEIDAGLTYIDNEPLGRVVQVPLYRERYRLITAADGPLGERERVTWREAGEVPLCLLTPSMQNRRIVDQCLREAGHEPEPVLESNSMIVLLTHMRTLGWASIMPALLVDPLLGISDRLRSIPIVEPDISHAIGLVAPHREPATPMVQALLAVARQIAPSLHDPIADGSAPSAFDSEPLSAHGTA
jgi:DNA-binding transcriptional LysR family regulator